MKASGRIAILSFVVVLVLSVSVLKAADESDWPTLLTFHQTIHIGRLALDPGTYLFQRSPGTTGHNAVMIYSVDKKRWDGMVLGNPVYRSKSSERFGVGSGEGAQFRYWFNPGWERGIQFPER